VRRGSRLAKRSAFSPNFARIRRAFGDMFTINVPFHADQSYTQVSENPHMNASGLDR
jgi:hypothetical protein